MANGKKVKKKAVRKSNSYPSLRKTQRKSKLKSVVNAAYRKIYGPVTRGITELGKIAKGVTKKKAVTKKKKVIKKKR